jgi:hypothetical protein
MNTKYKNVFVNPTPDELRPHRTGIAFDLDSVMNEGDYLRHSIAKTFGTTVSAVKSHDRPGGWEVFHFNIPGVSYKEMAKAINICIMEESPSAMPSPYMTSVMNYVYDVTAQPIAVVTARHKATVGVTRRWLDQNLNVPFIVYIVDGLPKAPVLTYLGADIFIDDRHKTVKGLINWIDHPVLYKRPWNQGRDESLGVVEINDLRDIIPMVNMMYGRAPLDWPCWVPFPTPEGERTKVEYVSEY